MEYVSYYFYNFVTTGLYYVDTLHTLFERCKKYVTPVEPVKEDGIVSTKYLIETDEIEIIYIKNNKEYILKFFRTEEVMDLDKLLEQEDESVEFMSCCVNDEDYMDTLDKFKGPSGDFHFRFRENIFVQNIMIDKYVKEFRNLTVIDNLVMVSSFDSLGDKITF